LIFFGADAAAVGEPRAGPRRRQGTLLLLLLYVCVYVCEKCVCVCVCVCVYYIKYILYITLLQEHARKLEDMMNEQTQGRDELLDSRARAEEQVCK
jgi:hypothetical protein